jgi:hypothetical protein
VTTDAVKLVPSNLTADFARLGCLVEEAERAGSWIRDFQCQRRSCPRNGTAPPPSGMRNDSPMLHTSGFVIAMSNGGP